MQNREELVVRHGDYFDAAIVIAKALAIQSGGPVTVKSGDVWSCIVSPRPDAEEIILLIARHEDDCAQYNGLLDEERIGCLKGAPLPTTSLPLLFLGDQMYERKQDRVKSKPINTQYPAVCVA